MNNCQICGRKLDEPGEPLSETAYGGLCLLCAATFMGNPTAMDRIRERQRMARWRIRGLNFGDRSGARWMFSIKARWDWHASDTEWNQLFELFTME